MAEPGNLGGFVELGAVDIGLILGFLNQSRETSDHVMSDAQSAVDESESTTISVTPSQRVATTVYECPCTESSTNKSSFFNLVCGCVRCLECLSIEIEIGLEKKSWPPKCLECNANVDFDYVRHSLPQQLVHRWDQVREEYSDPFPVYCATPDCNIYLPKSKYSDDSKWAVCATCNSRTCTICNNLKPWHTGNGKCPDTIEPESLEEMRRSGFKPCPWCKQMIERDFGCDHMHCDQCGKNFCYNCGRKKGRVELPCNCKGEHAWVDEAMEEMNPDAQQDILDRIQNGMNLPAGFTDIRDLDLLPQGIFRGIGRRVGEQGDEINDEAQVNIDLEIDQDEAHGDHPIGNGFNHWRAIHDHGDNGRLFRGVNFMGLGRRLGEEAEGAGPAQQEADNVANHLHEHVPGDWAAPPPANRFNFLGQGRRLGEPQDATGRADNQGRGFDEHDDVTGRDAFENNEYGAYPQYNNFNYYGQGRRLGEAPPALSLDVRPNDPDIVGMANARMSASDNTTPDGTLVDHYHDDYHYEDGGWVRSSYNFSGQGRRLDNILPQPEDAKNAGGAPSTTQALGSLDRGFNHWDAINHDNSGHGRHYRNRRFRGRGERLGD